ncbi:uncharacterized protein MELLADRAFT_61080 [Melampsora larici-populina 98AG31]|uniref:Uncharacterized protein n=1 Tax=Melampsora larici-populina (strain 98AG31 / pathotype 3-4-7) TaxID=747676 RepID=F4RDI8_MELLP|nr:uncharacterized protein MELLADRAFT_61080 [Melampsora larici-populina 98AG31]EGG09409.1 hypothetical protein MELLADRAFT_61080 [Melampsora larici-populina 98AG31]
MNNFGIHKKTKIKKKKMLVSYQKKMLQKESTPVSMNQLQTKLIDLFDSNLKTLDLTFFIRISAGDVEFFKHRYGYTLIKCQLTLIELFSIHDKLEGLDEVFEVYGIQCHVMDGMTCDEIMELDYRLNGPMK